MELAMILMVSSICGFCGGWNLNRGWEEKIPVGCMFGFFLIIVGSSSGIWIPLLPLL